MAQRLYDTKKLPVECVLHVQNLFIRNKFHEKGRLLVWYGMRFCMREKPYF